MLDKRKIKVVVLCFFLMALVTIIGISVLTELQYCMDAPLITEEELLQFSEVLFCDISQLTFNGEPVAADLRKNTIYISQSPERILHYSLLQGTLAFAVPEHEVYFVQNPALNDIGGSVQRGCGLSAVIVSGSNYQRLNVVVTTLPVLNVAGIATHQDEEGRAVWAGYATLWCGLDPSTEAYSTKGSALEWHVRGDFASYQNKKPWKLDLKDESGNNRNLDFLGLGADDDWILNSLTMDDTKIKEKLFMDLWNEVAARTNHNYNMSTGEYIEVVINGEYLGLFLLQRRIDAKYLELSDEDVLLKATDYLKASAEEAYEFITPEVNTEEVYTIMHDVFNGTDSSCYNMNNMIDTNLMLQLACAGDNLGSKNIYHVLRKTDYAYEHFLVPWDTDQSFGVVWKDDIGFCYDDVLALGGFGVRIETPALQRAYPEYDGAAAERWKYLRQTNLAEDNIILHINALYDYLVESGAFARDVSVWGIRYAGADSISALEDFVRERLDSMDVYYS